MSKRTKFSVDKYKIDSTPLSRLTRLSTAHLSEVLQTWSRIGNQRYKRMKKLDNFYTGVSMYEEKGKFGKSGVYKDRVTMVHELQRIKEIAPTLKKKEVEKEQQSLQGIQDNVSVESKTIEPETFKKAFGAFKQKHGFVTKKNYEYIKNIILKLDDNTSFETTVALIERLYNEQRAELYEKLQEAVDAHEDETLPF